jgi:hypothetical protein
MSEDAGVAVKSAEKGASGGGAKRTSSTIPPIPKRQPERSPAEPSGSGVGVQDKGLPRIRTRSSYRLFRELYEFLKDKPDVRAVLRKFYEVLDARGGFGSRANAGYAAESLGQVLRDVGDRDDTQQESEVL